MADHFVSIKRGVEGSKYSDFTTGTASTAGDLFEFRVADGVTPSSVEVTKALDAIQRFFQNRQQVVAAGFDVK